MTSRHYFFKIMKEDFRHKIWMLALSILGNILAFPVVFLIYAGNTYSYYEAPAMRWVRAAGSTAGFFSDILCITGGGIVIAGACIVGLGGFRYVFHQNMVDTYHSIPVKRRTLFAASWLNGFLIWFVPFFANLVITMLLGVEKLNRVKQAFFQASDRTPEMTQRVADLTSWDIFREGLLSAAALIVAFLLVYHLILVAVMLSGNLINALVLTGVGGAGAVSLYALWVCFEGYYFDTFLTNLSSVQDKMIYASPLVSAVYTLYARICHEEPGVGSRILVNLVIALSLGIVAALVYEKRPSELAGQGMRNRPVRALVQVAATLAAGMGGWILLYAISCDVSGEKTACAWGVFGSLLAAVLVFGVMDIIFHMDFKAFLAHKVLMAATLAGVLLICFGFCFDWVGYDAYLPEKEKIASLSVKAPLRNSGGSYNSDKLERATLRDVDIIYDFLENAVAHHRDGDTAENVESRPGEQPYRTETMNVKVTLNSGRSYYRRYDVYSYDNEAALRLLTSEEYMDAWYRIAESDVENITTIYLRRNYRDAVLQKGQDITGEEIRKICDACNQDMEEHPEVFIRGSGRVFATIQLEMIDSVNNNRHLERHFNLYEDMEHSREALRECGFGLFADPIAAEEIQEIRIESNLWASELKSGNIDLLEHVREMYAVYGTEEDSQQSSSDSAATPMGSEEKSDVSIRTEGETDENPIYVSVTDEAEIEELLELITYSVGFYSTGAFQKEPAGNLTIITKDGYECRTQVYEGTLPEKYILRFEP